MPLGPESGVLSNPLIPGSPKSETPERRIYKNGKLGIYKNGKLGSYKNGDWGSSKMRINKMTVLRIPKSKM